MTITTELLAKISTNRYRESLLIAYSLGETDDVWIADLVTAVSTNAYISELQLHCKELTEEGVRLLSALDIETLDLSNVEILPPLTISLIADSSIDIIIFEETVTHSTIMSLDDQDRRVLGNYPKMKDKPRLQF